MLKTIPREGSRRAPSLPHRIVWFIYCLFNVKYILKITSRGIKPQCPRSQMSAQPANAK